MSFEKQIVSASRRTDIPSYYSDWIIHRIREGYCETVNPFNRNQRVRVSLRPNDVAALAFWTKDPAPMMPFLDEITEVGLPFYFQFTLNDYPLEIEPTMPPSHERIRIMRELASKIGTERVIWRYDPILFTNLTDYQYHLDVFKQLCNAIKGSVDHCVISFWDDYRSATKRVAGLADKGIHLLPSSLEGPDFDSFILGLSETARTSSMRVFSCAEALPTLQLYGIEPGACIDSEYIGRVFGISVSDRKDKNQRSACGCVISKDIGVYDSCLHDCQYCYANHYQISKIRENYNKNRIDSTSML
jgi:hypothetical protein